MRYAEAGPLTNLAAAALIVTSLAAFCRAGSVFLSCLMPKRVTLKQGEWTLFSAALGTAAFCMAVYGLGLAGLLSRPTAWGLLAIFILLPFAANLFIKEKPYVEPFAWGGCPKFFHLVLYGACASALALSAIQALAPATGMDSLAYHLYLPREFAERGRIEFLPLTRESLWPLLSEMYFLFALVLQGTAAAQLFHWLFYGLTAALIYALTRRFYDKGTAVWASTIFIFTPVHFAQAGYAYVDLTLAFYALAAIYAFLLADAENDGRLVFLSGLFAGCAAATKYLGLDACLVLFIFTLIRFKAKPVPALQFLAGCAAVGAVWYLRSWVVAGNPFFPLYAKFFGGSGYDVDIAAGVGMGAGILDFFCFPWRLSMYPQNFGGQMFGAAYILFLPPLLFAAGGMKRHSRWLTAFGLAYCFLVFMQSQQARFYVSVAPYAAIAAGWSLHRFYFARAGWLQRLTAGVLAVVFLFYGAIFLYRVREKWKPVFGVERAEKYLLEHERSYKGWDWLHRNAGPNDRILNGAEVRYFYAPRELNVEHLSQKVMVLRAAGVDLSVYSTLESYLDKAPPDYIWVVQDTEPSVREYIAKKSYNLVFSYTFTEKPALFDNRIYARPKGID